MKGKWSRMIPCTCPKYHSGWSQIGVVSSCRGIEWSGLAETFSLSHPHSAYLVQTIGRPVRLEVEVEPFQYRFQKHSECEDLAELDVPVVDVLVVSTTPSVS